MTPPSSLARCSFLRYGIFLVAWGFATVAFAAPEYHIGPPPSWIERVIPDDAAVAPAQVSNGIYPVLSNVQTRVEARDQVQYRHIAMKALSLNGVEQVAHVEIRFDPSYQTLTLNMLNVRRDGRVMSKLGKVPVRLLQREKELEYRIFDGSKTANLFLDDVRVGDIVEYAYTLRGVNPVFDNRRFGGLDLQWSTPVHRVFGRLLWPVNREIHFVHHRTDLKPVVAERNGYRDYRWQAQNVPALVVESDAPAWYDPYPSVQWSEFPDWQAVARWAQPLYRVPDALSPALKAEIDAIARASTDPHQRLLAVLRFVQREIRYLGVEIGASSHAPSHPSLVLERRFGDCKDKTLLTIAMLQALGIEARPALVNTVVGPRINEYHPTPTAFNHVLVRARIGEQTYWVDPTRSPQQGTIDKLFQPNYGHALVVDATTRALVVMPQVIVSKNTIQVTLDARDGIEHPARYNITTTFEGGSAEGQRAALAAANPEQMQKNFLNFYARYYPTITTDQSFTVSEDERLNRLTITEQYVIRDFFRRAEEHKRRESDIYVPDVDRMLARPREPVRRAPLRLSHPVDVTQVTHVLLPESWGIKPERIAVDDAAFKFERQVDYDADGKKLILTDRYQSRADHVPAADVPRYVANLERAIAATSYSLQRADTAAAPAPLSAAERFNWPLAMVAMLVSVVCVWFALKIYRYDPAPRAGAVDEKLRGMRGWLIVPAIGAVVQPIRVGVEFSSTLPSYAVDTWSALTTTGTAAYHPMWAPLLLFELTANLALMVFAILLAIVFFQKRRIAPPLYVAVILGAAAMQVIDLFAANMIPAAAAELTTKDWNGLARTVIGALIWGTYFMVSKRVKATFVNEFPKPQRRVVMVASSG